MRETVVGVVGAPFRLVAELLLERRVEHLGERVLVLDRPPVVGGGIDALHQAAGLARQERHLVGHHELHLVEHAELLGLLDRQHRIVTPVDVDEDVRAGIGDVEQIGREVRRAERRDLVGDGGPARARGHILHRLGDGVAVGVVRRHVRHFFVLAELLDQHRRNRGRGGLAEEILAEAVAHAILAGGVVRAGDAAHEQHLFALRQLVERDRDRARRAAGDHHRLVLADETLLRLHRFVRLGGGVGDAELHFLAEHALGGLGRNLLEQFVAFIDVLDGKLVALEFVLALHRVSAGARHRGADEHRIARRAGRIGADRRMVFGERRHGKATRQHRSADKTGAALQQRTARHAPCPFLVQKSCFSSLTILPKKFYYGARLSSPPLGPGGSAGKVAKAPTAIVQFLRLEFPSRHVCQCHFRRRTL